MYGCKKDAESLSFKPRNKTKLCSRPALPVHTFNVWTIIMQSLNIKEWNLFELEITQTRHPLGILDEKMSKFNTPWK